MQSEQVVFWSMDNEVGYPGIGMQADQERG
jgi:hypothetical protein